LSYGAEMLEGRTCANRRLWIASTSLRFFGYVLRPHQENGHAI
jgi:hypothetical protein